jgi:alcohol oxidase
MPLSTQLPPNLTEVDIIICGGALNNVSPSAIITNKTSGGLAACVIAGRLAQASPALSILVIESGPNNEGNAAIESPALMLSHQLASSKTAAWYKAKRAEHLGERELMQSTGNVLGGGSSINFMV